MSRFEIYCESLLIGWSELETGDPPAGVAFGRFVPASGYTVIQGLVAAASRGEVAPPPLSVRVVGGPELQCNYGVYIADYSQELGAEEIQVSVLGISYPPYESLFPEHVAAYGRRFSNGA